MTTKNISPELQAHLASGEPTTCFLWRVVWKTGRKFNLTDLDKNLTYAGDDYLALAGFTASNIVTSDQLNVDNLELTSSLTPQNTITSVTISDADLLANLWDYASVEILRVNYNDLTMGHEWMRSGTIGEVSTGRVAFVAELRGLTQAYAQDIGDLILASCNANVGDARCGVNLTPYTFTGTVTAVTDNATFAASAESHASVYFTGGLLTWLTGLNAGYQMEVKAYTLHNFVLFEPMPNLVAIGDTYSVYKGCNKLTGAGGCGDFSNIVRFRGCPTVPGQDRLVSGT